MLRFLLCFCMVWSFAFAKGVSSRGVEVYHRVGRHWVRIFVRNALPAPVTITLRGSSRNMVASARLPRTVVVPARRVLLLLEWRRRRWDQRWYWRYWYSWKVGSFRARHSKGVLYRLPYGSGRGYRVIQGFGGKFSHRGGYFYSIDFRMPLRTPVLAARGGVVVWVRSCFKEGGLKAKYRRRANLVVVLHSDGTLGQYVHLDYRGVVVKVGERVRAGQLLGYSGNTGYSGSPHLHFMVSVPVDGERVRTVPVRFRVVGQRGGVILRAGRVYVSP